MTKLPADWEQVGCLPDVEPHAAAETDLDSFTEDLLHIAAPEERYTIDVGWVPQADLSGEFLCEVRRSEDWVAFETFRTRSLAEVQRWLTAVIERLRMDLGDPAESDDELVLGALHDLDSDRPPPNCAASAATTW